MTLTNPLPVPLDPGRSAVILVKHKENMRLKVTGGKYHLKVDNHAWDITAVLPAGTHRLELENSDSRLRLYNVRAEVSVPYVPPPQPKLKKIEEIFPIITEKKPLFRDFEYNELKEWAANPTPISRRTKGRFLNAIRYGLMNEAHYKPFHKAHYIDWALGTIDLQIRLFNKRIEDGLPERPPVPYQKPY